LRERHGVKGEVRKVGPSEESEKRRSREGRKTDGSLPENLIRESLDRSGRLERKG